MGWYILQFHAMHCDMRESRSSSPVFISNKYQPVNNRQSLKKRNVDDAGAGYALIRKTFIGSVGPCAWTRAPYKGAGLNMRALRMKKGP